MPQDEQTIIEETMGIGSRLPTRERWPPSEWWKPWEPQQVSMEQITNNAQEQHGQPQSYVEACRCPDAQDWKKAAKDEMKNHAENNTWSLVPRPDNCNVIGSRWVFKLKYNADSTIKRHKARLIMKGYNQ